MIASMADEPVDKDEIGFARRDTTHSVDVAIVGTGPAGLAAALALAGLGLETVCIGPTPKPSASNPDTRTAALLSGSIDFLDSIGTGKPCRAAAAPLEAIRIIDDTGRLIRAPESEFRASELGLDAFGYNVPNDALVSALYRQFDNQSRARHIATKAVTAITPLSNSVRLETAEGQEIEALLVVGADGRKSPTRAAANVETVKWAYEQTALACNFTHTLDHKNVSTEFHRPSGPFTTVPLPGRDSSLVWVESPAEAQRLMSLNDEEFARAIESRLHGLLGDVVAVGRRAAFPLTGLTAKTFARRRIALVGEAAHVLPPIGAQGLNLGFRDIVQLTDCVAEAQRTGADIGGDGVMQAYSFGRRGDVWSRSAAVDLLNRSLLSGFLPVQAARSIGLHLLNAVAPLRRFVMRQGLAPSMPKTPPGHMQDAASAPSKHE